MKNGYDESTGLITVEVEPWPKKAMAGVVRKALELPEWYTFGSITQKK